MPPAAWITPLMAAERASVASRRAARISSTLRDVGGEHQAPRRPRPRAAAPREWRRARVSPAGRAVRMYASHSPRGGRAVRATQHDLRARRAHQRLGQGQADAAETAGDHHAPPSRRCGMLVSGGQGGGPSPARSASLRARRRRSLAGRRAGPPSTGTVSAAGAAVAARRLPAGRVDRRAGQARHLARDHAAAGRGPSPSRDSGSASSRTCAVPVVKTVRCSGRRSRSMARRGRSGRATRSPVPGCGGRSCEPGRNVSSR